ncbi:MAG TPA: ATP-binding protein, partial [Candidatus Saccharimonadales bacterium]|nr:ATP-binding protein [Candidatus Saccharimonadales bacterium]
MNGLIIALGVVLVIVMVAAPIIFVQVRRIFREQKNYERGLKMVPLLIHLPPLSEDADAAGRDVRDLMDENISKAQVMYDIIASTLQKGFKSRFYGQRHISLEIVGSRGFVNFYAAVPVVLVDVVRQAIVSAYPTARVEEVAEHNIFSPVGKISGTVGGELVLKESYAYPIA